MIKKIVFLTFLAVFTLSSIAFSEVLTQADFIKRSIQTNPKYMISVKDYLSAIQANKGDKAIDDWNLIASGNYQAGFPPPSAFPFSIGTKAVGYTVGIEKYFSQTGTAIKVDHTNTENDTDFAIPGFPAPASPYYIGSVSLTITQPLLKNAFGAITKSSLDMSDHALELAKIKLDEDWEEFIATLKNDYAVWQKCHLDVNIYENKLISVTKQQNLVKKQVQLGLSEDLDLVQIEQLVKGYEILLQTAKMSCDSQTEKISKLLGKTNSIEPEVFTQSNSVPEKDASITYVRNNSNIKKTTDLLVSIRRSALNIAENNENIDLNLVLSASPNTSQTTYTDSMSKIGTEQFYMASIRASRPLFNSKADAGKNKAKEDYEKAVKESENILINSEIGISNLYTSLSYLDKMLTLNNDNLKLAKERLKLEQRKYSQGRSSVFFLLQAEDALLEAEKNLNQTLFTREGTINQIKSFTDHYIIEYKDILRIEELK